MNTWIALFRGINVGGNNVLPMNELKAVLEKIGCTEVGTYIQSGNVVFRHSGTNGEQLADLIGKSVADSHGFQPMVLLLTVKELESNVRNNPFPDATANPKSLTIFFLTETPVSPAIDEMNDVRTNSESFSLIGNAFYMHAPDGFGRSKLAARAEKLLGVRATARNWRTVTKTLALANLE